MATPSLPELPARLKPVLSSAVDPSPHADSPAPTAHHDHPAQVALSEQNGLTTSQAAGIKAVEHILLANNGGLSSGTPLPPSSPPQLSANPMLPSHIPAPRSSSTRSMTRSFTAPGALVSQSPASPAQNTQTSVTSPHDHSDDSAPLKISTLDHFQMRDWTKVTTAKPIAEYAASNVAILADAVRMMETDVDMISRDLANLTVEVRLRPQNESSPAPSTWQSLYGVRPRSESPTQQCNRTSAT
ncbi:hypothetical protein B0H19DRAFT_1172993 [Mycena capillaripes]|nr:hypothetical protein B0H19DRAFT_1172993 [Mycena capillaripes]